jgi:hypothetical protein
MTWTPPPPPPMQLGFVTQFYHIKDERIRAPQTLYYSTLVTVLPKRLKAASTVDNSLKVNHSRNTPHPSKTKDR